MLVKKKINNNFALCIDSNNNEIIAYGKGIGFKKTPYQLDDLSLIEKTFYDIDNHFIALTQKMPDEVFVVSSKIVEIASSYLNYSFPPNLILALADHIMFAIQRKRQGMFIKNPLAVDFEYLYVNEVEMGRIALKMIKKDLYEVLPDEEAINIAIHFITAETSEISCSRADDSINLIVDDVTNIIEKELNIRINKDNINYSRFVIHLRYLLKNKDNNYDSNNTKPSDIINKIKYEYEDIYKVSQKVGDYLLDKVNRYPSEDELLYLTLHIYRLYNRNY